MSRPAPDYCNNEDFLKWFDFDKNEFKEGAPQWLIDMVRAKKMRSGNASIRKP